MFEVELYDSDHDGLLDSDAEGINYPEFPQADEILDD
jgi:hypothetical protein